MRGWAELLRVGWLSKYRWNDIGCSSYQVRSLRNNNRVATGMLRSLTYLHLGTEDCYYRGSNADEEKNAQVWMQNRQQLREIRQADLKTWADEMLQPKDVDMTE